jgi:hypothetical protein
MFPMPDMPCYPYVTKEHRTIMNDRELLDWIREKAGDDMAELVDMRLNDKNCPALKEIKNVLSVLIDNLDDAYTSIDNVQNAIVRWEKNG